MNHILLMISISFMFDPLYESICCMLASGLPWIDIDQSSVKNMKLHSFLHWKYNNFNSWKLSKNWSLMNLFLEIVFINGSLDHQNQLIVAAIFYTWNNSLKITTHSHTLLNSTKNDCHLNNNINSNTVQACIYCKIISNI